MTESGGRAIASNDCIDMERRASLCPDIYAWWGSPDVCAALHRSVGLGLPVAEAILAGYAVVATGWPGNAHPQP